jgi:hypothetical protein
VRTACATRGAERLLMPRRGFERDRGYDLELTGAHLPWTRWPGRMAITIVASSARTCNARNATGHLRGSLGAVLGTVGTWLP